MKFFALVALALVGSANAAAVTAFTSVTRSKTLATGATLAQAGDMVITFQAATNLAGNDTITINSTRPVFGSDGQDAGCTIKSNNAGVTVTSALISGGAGKVLTVKMGAALSNAHAAVITCTQNLLALGSAGAEAFVLRTNKDSTDKVCAAPYTVNNGKATWTSAARSNLGATQTTGNLVLKFTTQNALPADGTFKATASTAIFATDSTNATTCTATCDGTANVVKTTTIADTKKSIEIKLTDACAANKAVVANCTGNLLNPSAANITFGFVTSTDIVPLTAETGFTVTAAPGPAPGPAPAPAPKAPTKAPTNGTATVAAASTDGVSAGLAFTALCLAFTALRQ